MEHAMEMERSVDGPLGARKRPSYSREPGLVPPGAPVEAIRAEFARRLNERMSAKGWSQSDLARAMAAYTDDKKFDRSSVSVYANGKGLPREAHLSLLLRALGCKREDLLPESSYSEAEQKLPPLSIKAVDDETSFLSINQAVPTDIALEVAALLRKAKREAQ